MSTIPSVNLGSEHASTRFGSAHKQMQHDLSLIDNFFNQRSQLDDYAPAAEWKSLSSMQLGAKPPGGGVRIEKKPQLFEAEVLDGPSRITR